MPTHSSAGERVLGRVMGIQYIALVRLFDRIECVASDERHRV
jgi:hypothetical protein